MATFKALDRLRRSFSTTSLYRARHYHSLPNTRRDPNPTAALSSLLHPISRRERAAFTGALGTFSSRSIFTRSDDDSEFFDSSGFTVDSLAELAAESKVLDSGLAYSTKESILPVRAVISIFEEVHDYTGLPWWIVIACSTVTLRATLFPLLIFQLHKLKRIGELFHQLPPPFPPPFSGQSYIDHISKFREKRKEIGCPSFLWFLTTFCVQVPCFFLWMTSIRRMSLNHHPGFDCGGALWFQDLTEFSHGASGFIFPVVIAGLHYTNIQISFRTPSASKTTGLLDLLVKYYKIYLDIMTVPIFFMCFYVPQGSLVYWVTNSSLTCIQQLSLKQPSVREKLGIPESKPSPSPGSTTLDSTLLTPSNESEKKKIVFEELSPKELIALSVQQLSKGKTEIAIHILQVALSKDPEYSKALILMGQTLLQQGLTSEAIEYLERAISKLILDGSPTEVEDTDHLILASMWAGSAYVREGELEEGLVHLERIGKIKEPEDPKAKSHYFDGLLMLSSALYNAGRREEAIGFVRLAIAYNPAYNEFLEQIENDTNSIDTELANSRRRDY